MIKFILTAMLCSANILANTSSTTIDTKHKNKNDKWDLEFLIASEQTKDIVTTEYDGTYTKFDTSVLQKLDANNELRYFLSTRYIETKSEEFGNEFEFFFTEFMYRRKNILTESDHGLYLEAEIKNYWINDEDIKQRYGYDGTFIPQVIMKKRFGRAKSVQLKLRRHFYQTNNTDNYILNFEDRVYLSYSQMIGRRFLFNTQLKYQHKIRKGNGLDYRFMQLASFNPRSRRMDFSKVPKAKKHQELLTIHPGISYFINRSNMIEFYVETKLSNTYDKRDLESIMQDEFVLGTALYLTAF